MAAKQKKNKSKHYCYLKSHNFLLVYIQHKWNIKQILILMDAAKFSATVRCIYQHISDTKKNYAQVSDRGLTMYDDHVQHVI